jgi:hypothetical protein
MKAIVAVLLLILGVAMPARAAEGGRTYALVSAIGSSLTYVRQKMGTGSHREPYDRSTLKVPDASLDASALRGLEHVLKQTDPEARFVYLRVNPAELEGVEPWKRGDTAVGKLATQLERMPERAKWHQVVVITPRYVPSEREGLASKLNGIGVFVQPMHQGFLDNATALGQPDDIDAQTPTGEPVRASSYIAPYFYAQVWVLDAQSLEVLYTSERYDFKRIHDPKSTAIDIEKAIPPETLGPLVESFVQTASARALREAIGVVTVTEPKIVQPR